MTEKQKIFADEYLIDLNGTRAYKAAYPNIKSDNAAAVRANKLLKKKKSGIIFSSVWMKSPVNVLLNNRKSWNI